MEIKNKNYKLCVCRNGWCQQAEILQHGPSNMRGVLTPALAPVTAAQGTSVNSWELIPEHVNGEQHVY